MVFRVGGLFVVCVQGAVVVALFVLFWLFGFWGGLVFGIISCSLFYVITSCWWLIVYVCLGLIVLFWVLLCCCCFSCLGLGFGLVLFVVWGLVGVCFVLGLVWRIGGLV